MNIQRSNSYQPLIRKVEKIERIYKDARRKETKETVNEYKSNFDKKI